MFYCLTIISYFIHAWGDGGGGGREMSLYDRLYAVLFSSMVMNFNTTIQAGQMKNRAEQFKCILFKNIKRIILLMLMHNFGFSTRLL